MQSVIGLLIQLQDGGRAMCAETGIFRKRVPDEAWNMIFWLFKLDLPP
jgi:hypothetical protein